MTDGAEQNQVAPEGHRILEISVLIGHRCNCLPFFVLGSREARCQLRQLEVIAAKVVNLGKTQ